MGYLVELNTLLGVPKDFDVTSFAVGKYFTILKDRERAFPLHLAILLIYSNWNFYGYCVAHSAIVKSRQTEIEFEVISLFSPEEQKLYKKMRLEYYYQSQKKLFEDYYVKQA